MAILSNGINMITEFIGIHNRLDNKRLPLGTLISGSNIDIDNSNNIRRRSGYALAASYTDITASYKNYVIDSGSLIDIISGHVLETGFGTDIYKWCEDTNRIIVYGYKKGYIENNRFIDMVIPICPSVVTNNSGTGDLKYITAVYKNSAGLTGGASAPVLLYTGDTYIIITASGMTPVIYESIENGQILYNQQSIPLDEWQIGSYPPPDNSVDVEIFKTQLYVAEYIRQDNKTVIWFSQPYMYHRFNKAQDYFAVPGKCTNLVSTEDNLIISTEDYLYSYNGTALIALADYGAPIGSTYAEHDDKRVFMFTNQGICRLNPFENLTKMNYDSNIVLSAVSQIVESNGYTKFITITRN